MAEGGSFLSASIGEPSRRAFLEFERRLNATQAALATDITGHIADADPHPQYLLADGTRTASELTVTNNLTVDTDTLKVDSTTNRVGIGTTSPAKELDVVGDVQVSGRLGIGSGISAELDIKGASNPEIRLQSTDSTDPYLYFGDQVDAVRGGIGYDISADALLLRGYNNSIRMTIDSAGNVGIGTASPQANLSLGTGYSTFSMGANDSTGFHWAKDTSALNLYTGAVGSGTHRFGITTDGNVGIGVSSPLYALHVSGDIGVNGKLYFGNSALIANEISSTNIDHIWHDDGSNAWNFCSDTTYRAAGNSTLIAGAFSGSGASLTSLNASNLSSGTVPDGRISGAYSGITTLTVTSGILLPDGSSGTPAVRWSSDTNTGFYRPGADRIGVTCGSSIHEFRTDGIHLGSGDWFRSYSDTGWYNQTHGGGWYMTDTVHVRAYNGKGIRTERGGGSNYDTASIFINSANNAATLSFHPGGQAPQIRVGYNVNTGYWRNFSDTSYATWAAVIANQSSREDKQDITDFANAPSSLSSDANDEFTLKGMDLVRRLRPVHYRWKRDTYLRQLPLSPRRTEALSRLNKYRENRGLGEFLSDESWHRCGRDCDGSATEPCFRVRDWQSGQYGFIAEEVHDVAPEAGRIVTDTEQSTAIDALAMSAIIVAALQEIDTRLTSLETV